MTRPVQPLGFKVENLPLKELVALNDALLTVNSVVTGLQEQPRFRGPGVGDHSYNEAGWMLSAFSDQIGWVLADIADAAAAQSTKSEHEIRCKFYLAARPYFNCSDRPSGTIAEFAQIWDTLSKEGAE